MLESQLGTNANDEPIELDVIPGSHDKHDVKIQEIRVVYHLKKLEGQALEAAGSTSATTLAAQPQASTQLSKSLPLVVEAMKGAQTSDNMQPSLILNNCSNVFCSNYPQPEFIFKHQHDAPFVMTSFTVKSLFNREANGMPIGKGYVFASQCLDDIYNTRRFINGLSLSGKEWEPREEYVPSEPIGRFELNEELSVTVDLPPQYQQSFRFVKLVPTGFRKGPINFSKTKFHSKQAEI